MQDFGVGHKFHVVEFHSCISMDGGADMGVLLVSTYTQTDTHTTRTFISRDELVGEKNKETRKQYTEGRQWVFSFD